MLSNNLVALVSFLPVRLLEIYGLHGLMVSQ
jgi:hypothetical protein